MMMACDKEEEEEELVDYGISHMEGFDDKGGDCQEERNTGNAVEWTETEIPF